MTDEKRHVNSF